MAVLSGTFQPGGKITFELPLEVDLCTKINLRVRLAPITFTPSANLLYARYVDFVGLNMIDEVRLRFGTEKLQTVSRDEIFCKMMSYYADEEKYNLMKLVGGGMTPAQRDDAATSDQEIIIPLLTLLGVHLYGDPSQNLFLRGLGEKVRVEVDLAPFNTLYEISRPTATLEAITAPAATAVFTEQSLYVEGQHLYETERQALEQIYAQKRSYTFDEIQRSVRLVVPGSTTLASGQISATLDNISQPTQSIYVLLRWEQDLIRTAGLGVVSALTSWPQGRDYTNVGGWYNVSSGVRGCYWIVSLTRYSHTARRRCQPTHCADSGRQGGRQLVPAQADPRRHAADLRARAPL